MWLLSERYPNFLAQYYRLMDSLQGVTQVQETLSRSTSGAASSRTTTHWVRVKFYISARLCKLSDELQVQQTEYHYPPVTLQGRNGLGLPTQPHPTRNVQAFRASNSSSVTTIPKGRSRYSSSNSVSVRSTSTHSVSNASVYPPTVTRTFVNQPRTGNCLGQTADSLDLYRQKNFMVPRDRYGTASLNGRNRQWTVLHYFADIHPFYLISLDFKHHQGVT